MTQLTIRFGADLERHIRALAKRERLSLNQAAVRLLRKGAGMSQGEGSLAADTVGDSLDDLIGTWSADEAAGMADALAVFERVDAELWR